MSVAEMRRILGLGKTDAYWLVHQGYFEMVLVNGKMRVVIDSFEAWYAMQTKHRKVTGEEPGTRLLEESLSAGEIAELLGISKQQANVLIRQEELPFFKVHCQFQVPKEAFEQWYASQSHYVKRQERAAALSGSYISAPEIARRLGVGRNTVYSILRSGQGKAMLEMLRLGDRLYVEAGSFARWLESQSKYREQRRAPAPRLQLRKPKNPAFYTVEEVCRFYGLCHTQVYEQLTSGDLPAVRTGKTWRIKRKEFDELLTERSEKGWQASTSETANSP